MGVFGGFPKYAISIAFRALALVCLTASLGCAVSGVGKGKKSSSASSASLNCELTQDQVGTFLGRWAVTPIQLALQDGNWGTTDSNRIFTAADTWNQFYNTSRGFPLLDTGQLDSLRTSSSPKPTDAILCTESLITENQFTDAVVVYKENLAWAHGTDVIALTTTCSVSDSPFARNYMAIMEVNFVNFFRPTTRQPDLQAIMLHEYGHLIGLNHSCEDQGDTGVPDCNSGSIDAKYVEAVMFPQVVFNPQTKQQEQVKRVLKENDQGRANCLYDPIR